MDLVHAHDVVGRIRITIIAELLNVIKILLLFHLLNLCGVKLIIRLGILGWTSDGVVDDRRWFVLFGFLNIFRLDMRNLWSWIRVDHALKYFELLEGVLGSFCCHVCVGIRAVDWDVRDSLMISRQSSQFLSYRALGQQIHIFCSGTF